VERRVIENAADDVIAVLDNLGCERVVVLGAIGTLELQFAATHPERTSALVLISPTARRRRADRDGTRQSVRRYVRPGRLVASGAVSKSS
jgi:pimeloyl-ACP methyl ester carboxylesterase